MDGAENNPPSFYLSGQYEVARHFSLNEHTFVPDVLLVSFPVWKSLTPQQQEWLQLAADDSVVYQRELWQQAEQEALEALRADGVTITVPDKAPFRAAVAEMQRSFAGTPVGRFIDRINEVK